MNWLNDMPFVHYALFVCDLISISKLFCRYLIKYIVLRCFVCYIGVLCKML